MYSCDTVIPEKEEENKEQTNQENSENEDIISIPEDGIIFSSIRNSTGNIWVMDSDGLNPRAVNKYKGFYDVHSSSSYDGKKIVFFRPNVGLIIVDKTGEKVLLELTTADDCQPTWSPDNKIYYCRRSELGQILIYSINEDGTGDTRISPVYNSEYNPLDEYPSVSPDNKYLLFCTNRDGYGIVKMNFENNKYAYLTNTSSLEISGASQPSWSPDGKKIAFVAYPGESYEEEKLQIYVMNQDGSNKIKLTNDNLANCFCPSWSPDGKKIVFEKDYPGFSYDMEIWIMNADGSSQKALTDRNITIEDYHPCFIGKPR